MRNKLLLTSLLIVQFSFGAIDSFYKEVIQRGYELLPGDSVKFPDGTSCSIEAFNAMECGVEWMTKDYCVPEGEYVWDADRCCVNLAPFLEKGVDGQETCQPIAADEGGFSDFFSSSTVLYFFIGVLIPLALFVILAISVKKRLPKKED